MLLSGNSLSEVKKILLYGPSGYQAIKDLDWRPISSQAKKY